MTPAGASPASRDKSTEASVCPARKRYAEGGVEQCECDARDETELRVGELQIGLDRLQQEHDQSPIQQAEHVDGREDRENVAPVCIAEHVVSGVSRCREPGDLAVCIVGGGWRAEHGQEQM